MFSANAIQVDDKLYADDVFSTYLYTGNGNTQTINNGIDLAGKGGLVWTRVRSQAAFGALNDSSRGVSQTLQTPYTSGQANYGGITAFNSNGYTIGSYFDEVNFNGASIVSWTFRKAPKFFDVVKFTTDSNGLATFNHSLGVTPGMVILKATSTTSGWNVWHKNLSTNRHYVQLNTTAAEADLGTSWITTNSSSVSITYGNVLPVNASCVAHLFAHDPSADGIIQCGSFTTGASTTTVNLGWEPQFVLIKRTDSASNWIMTDCMRGYNMTTTDLQVQANTSNAESTLELGYPTASGFVSADTTWGSGASLIYLAIRRPNKPPTTGTQVYNAIARTGTRGAATVTGVGFPVDLVISGRMAVASGWEGRHTDRIRGAGKTIASTSTSAEATDTDGILGLDSMDGYRVGADTSYLYVNGQATSFINWNFRRAPGFFDVVCYTGTGVARTVPHNLGVAPELMIVKNRSSTNPGGWWVYVSTLGVSKNMRLNADFAPENATEGSWNLTAPSASVFSVGTSLAESSMNYVAYLFATLPGISKVGSYTGNGTSQTINCGFSTGARFVLVKCTSTDGNWYVWDTARGIVSANDPHLSLNTTAAEVTTDDTIDPDNSGFIVNQVAATNVNVSAATYIYLAIA